MARRLLATAAMIMLLGVLGTVVYQVVAPVPGTSIQPPMIAGANKPEIEITKPATGAIAAADSTFSGRLEIRTAAFLHTDGAIVRAIESNGLADFVKSETVEGTKVYRLVSTREGVNRLLTSLEGVWQDFDGATLQVDGPGDNATTITIEAVTPKQAICIVAQDTTQASAETARSYAMQNSLALNVPGGEILTMLDDDTGTAWDLASIDDNRVRLTETIRKPLAPPEGKSEASLTIVLLHAR